MNKQEYQDLIKCRFLSQSGSVQSYWSRDDRPHKISDIRLLILKDLEVKLDYNNLIILFPVSWKYSDTTCLIGSNHQESFPIDHCTNIVDIRDFLDEKGIKYKNNIKMTADKYKQYPLSMLVIQDGIAYAHSDCANPFVSDLCYHSSDFASEIKYQNKEDKHINFDNKEIIFSGILCERMRQNIE